MLLLYINISLQLLNRSIISLIRKFLLFNPRKVVRFYCFISNSFSNKKKENINKNIASRVELTNTKRLLEKALMTCGLGDTPCNFVQLRILLS